MNRSRLFLVLNAAIASFAFACTAPADDSASSDDAITGSLASAKACAVRDAYTAAELSAFKTAAKTELPNVQESSTASLSKFDVTGLGTVFVVQDGAVMSFYDANGALLAKASGDADLVWTQANSAALSCGAQQPPAPDAGPPPANPNATCLSTAPIDQTQFPYNPATPAAAGKCTAQEVAAISSYYSQHAADPDFSYDSWKAAVSANCSSCAFGDLNNATWAPIVTSFDGQLEVNRGGCVEAVSHNADCGRAYQQYQDCTVQACLVQCTTQDEFTKCRQDATVLSTSCKGAVDALYNACGQENIAAYESACQGTTYTFEGPIKVMCVDGH
jgi:hypothetical protein